MNERIRSATQSDWVKMAVGAFLASLMTLFAAWLTGFVEMKYDVRDQGKLMMKFEKTLAVLETKMDATQRDVSDLKLGGAAVDARLQGDISVIQSQHRSMESELSRLNDIADSDRRRIDRNTNTLDRKRPK